MTKVNRVDAVAFARKHPDREVVFFAVGFETTAPANALAVHQAHTQGLLNFTMLDILLGIQECVRLLQEGRNQVSNQYARVVCRQGNTIAQDLMLDPLYVANEGRMVVFLPENQADQALELMRSDPLGATACAIGRVSKGRPGLVTAETAIGTRRVVDMFSGEQLPRIC